MVADIHCGPDADTQLGGNAPALLGAFCEAMHAFKPDLIVDLGDRLNPVASGPDQQRTCWARRSLIEIGVPVYHVIGNTDVANVTKAELTGLLAKGGPYERMAQWDPQVVLLDSQDPPCDRVGGGIGPDQLSWLGTVLEGHVGASLIFCHRPLDEQDLRGHRYFASRPHLAHVRNRPRIRELFERGDQVLAVFAGHMHWTRATVINGIPYVTLGSLVDCAYTDGRSSGTFAAVTVRGHSIDIRIAGLQPTEFQFSR